MYEIRNKTKSPVQVIVRSKKAPRAFTTLIIPGIGAENNTRIVADELMTEYIERVEKMQLISTKYIPNVKKVKGDISYGNTKGISTI